MNRIEQSNYPVDLNIKKVINNKGLKANKIAEICGYNAQQFYEMLNGKRLIKVSELVRISQALNVNIIELLK